MTDSSREIVLWTGVSRPTPHAPEQATHGGTTLGLLVEAYQVDPLSPFHKLRYAVRRNHIGLLRRVADRHGSTPLAAISGRTLIGWHAEWLGDGKVAMAHSFVAQLRTLFGFGFTLLSDPHCERLCAVLGKMRFPMSAPRVERLTADQAIAVRRRAHEIGWHSIALAQAFQFELMLRQRDVIGEWVPEDEPGETTIHWRGQKWLRGLWWSEIDERLVLRHTTSKRQKPVIVDLRHSPMVMEEIRRLQPDQRHPNDPVIICEATAMPYSTAEFRRKWRVVAEEAGVPKNVRNMDSRSGAISEAFEAGIQGEQIQKTATHSDIAMTQRYNRGDYQATATGVQIARAAHREAEAVIAAERGGAA